MSKQKNTRRQHLDRRNFIKATSILGLGSLLMPTAALAAEGTKKKGGECEPTTDDIQGPFYLAGSPNTTAIAGPDEPGDRLFISGTILSNDCMTPVVGAMIEVWQANEAAQYDTSANFDLRGTFHSDANGHYAFETIMPGAYLNGSQYRPKHIHYKVSKPGFPTLVTQLYFEGDEFIPADPWASQDSAVDRIIPLNPIGGGQMEGVFDIVLDGFVGIKPNRYGEEGYLMPAYPNPSNDLTSLHFNVYRRAAVKVIITDTDGRELVTLINKVMEQGRFTTQWDGRDDTGAKAAAGSYLATLYVDGKAITSQRIVRG